MYLEKWKNEQVPDVEGLLFSSGQFYGIDGSRLVETATPEITDYLEVCVLNSEVTYDGKYRIKCGEAANHGSIGVIVLEQIITDTPIWSLVLDWSNPFNQIEPKGGYYIVLSTSGSVFRFRPVIENVGIFIT